MTGPSFRSECQLEFERSNDRSEELLRNDGVKRSVDEAYAGRATRRRGAYFAVYHRVFWTSDENETFHLNKVCEFSWIEFADCDRVRFLLVGSNKLSEVRDKWKVGSCAQKDRRER